MTTRNTNYNLENVSENDHLRFIEDVFGNVWKNASFVCVMWMK